MQFNFPQDKKTETLNISIYLRDINKVRTLSKKYNCTINDVYKTIINEALEDYESQFGEIEEDTGKKIFSPKRDVFEVGDGLGKEVDKINPDATGFEAIEIARDIKNTKKKTEVNLDITEEELENWELQCEECGYIFKEDNEVFDYNTSLYCKDCFDKKSNIKPKPTTLEEKIEQDKQYAREYYQKNKDRLVEKKKELRNTKGISEKEKAQKGAYMKEYKQKQKQLKETASVEKLPKDWYKKEVIESQIPQEEFLYCANGDCTKAKFGKFLKGIETIRNNKTFCSTACADKIYPDRKPLLQNFTEFSYCYYLMCPKKKYLRSQGIEVQGKNFCSDTCYEKFLDSIKHKDDQGGYYNSPSKGAYGS